MHTHAIPYITANTICILSATTLRRTTSVSARKKTTDRKHMQCCVSHASCYIIIYCSAAWYTNYEYYVKL